MCSQVKHFWHLTLTACKNDCHEIATSTVLNELIWRTRSRLLPFIHAARESAARIGEGQACLMRPAIQAEIMHRELEDRLPPTAGHQLSSFLAEA
jgi:hypothetical protein